MQPRDGEFRKRHPLMLVVSLVAGSCFIQAGGSSARDASPTSTSPIAGAATYEIVSDASVAAGLNKLVPLAAAVAAKTTAKDRSGKAAAIKMYDTWFTFEGTIRKKDQSLYLDMEDALVAVKVGQEQSDARKALKGATDLAALARKYLAAHPAKESPTPTPELTTPPIVVGPSRVVGIRLNEWKIAIPTTIQGGNITFVVSNKGKQTHEFVVFRSDVAPNKLKLNDEGRVDEKGPGVTLVDERENIKPGTTAKLRISLTPGTYVFACNLPSHYKNGMIKQVKVT